MAQRGRAEFCVSFSSFRVFVIFVHVMYYVCNHINQLSYTSKIGLLQIPPRSASPQSPMYGHIYIYIYVFPTYRARGKRGHIGFGHSPPTNIFDCSLAPGKPQRSLLLTKYLWDSLVFYPTSKQSLAVRMVMLCFHVCVNFCSPSHCSANDCFDVG